MVIASFFKLQHNISRYFKQSSLFADPVLNEAAKILRLLYIKELRNLQTKINETIVELQLVTANPKTDSSLGKVGI
jgi:hypothetical protein